MKISIFKLKFQASQITHFTASLIITKILKELKNKKYQIHKVTEKSVAFKCSQFRLISNFKAVYVLDGGNFEIIKSTQETVVILNYFINILYSLIIIAVIITFVIIKGEYFGVFFFGIFYLMATGFQYIITKNAGKELLRNILIDTSITG